MGLLEVILGDFEKSIDNTKSNEEEAQTKFEEFEKESKESMKTKEDDIENKQQDVLNNDDTVTDAKDAIKDAKELKAGSIVELEKLQVMCVEGASSFEERAKKREEEIEALEGAKKILEDMGDLK